MVERSLYTQLLSIALQTPLLLKKTPRLDLLMKLPPPGAMKRLDFSRLLNRSSVVVCLSLVATLLLFSYFGNRGVREVFIMESALLMISFCWAQISARRVQLMAGYSALLQLSNLPASSPLFMPAFSATSELRRYDFEVGRYEMRSLLLRRISSLLLGDPIDFLGKKHRRTVETLIQSGVSSLYSEEFVNKTT
jgi:hypothetical protein